MEQSRRKRYLARLGALKKERSSWDSHWRELNDFLKPRRSRFFGSERNQGTKKNVEIINGTGTKALRIIQSGMMAGLTPRSRPWYRMTTHDPDLAEYGAVRSWLHLVEDRIRTVLAKSNVYNGLHGVYGDLPQFGSSALHVEEDAEDFLRSYAYPIGSFCLANSARGKVDTCYRELSMTVGQLVERFGLEACSPGVREQYERGHLDNWVEVVHVVEPRRDRDTRQSDARNMPWASCWMEAKGNDQTGFLRESGYVEFPILAPRWDVLGEDVYGSSPGMETLGDVKGLQYLEQRKAYLVDRIADPPLRAPSALSGKRISMLPGDVTYVDVAQGGQTLEPVMEVDARAVEVVEASTREHEQRINSMLFADLWMLVAQSGQDDPRRTATEVAALMEEKRLQLGPVLERLEDELLGPLLGRAFGVLLRAGELPPPPQEMQGQELHIEYISVLAQAQKLVGITGLERLSSYTINLAQSLPGVLDKLDGDKLVTEYAESLGVKPDLLVAEDKVLAIRQQRAQQKQAEQQAQAALAAAQGAKTLSETNTTQDNGLTRMLGTLGAPPPAGGA